MTTPEKAVSIDEYIDRHRAEFRAGNLNELRNLLPQLREKGAAAAAAGEDQLSKDAIVLERVIASGEAAHAGDPLPVHLAEAGVAASYLLKGVDIIPDFLPEIGFCDDACIVARVLERNPSLTAS